MLYEWATTTAEGQRLKQNNILGFVGKDLKYMKITAISIGRPRDPEATNYPIYL